MVTVLEEILEWSQDRPNWQRDALRRLVLSGDLSDDDVHELSEICKSTHGLTEYQEVVTLSKEHIPKNGSSSTQVTLDSIFHHRGVNALAEGQTLRFIPGLTVVYGDNAAGKTGYIRILKSACRARGQENILGNVVSGGAPFAPVVSIKYRIGTDVDTQEWAGEGEDEFISRVSVFDSQCASVYLTEKTDVAFRPFGLDLFDKLVQACKAIRAKLDREKQSLIANNLQPLQTQIPEGTVVANLIEGLTSLTKYETVQNLAKLSPQEEANLAQLEKSLRDLAVTDPEKLIQQLTLRSGRVRTLALQLKDIETTLSEEAITAVFDARTETNRKTEEANRLRLTTFPSGMLEGTGSERWKVLWESARHFSEERAYPDQDFPSVEDGDHCLLCQQDLDHDARHRLKQFEEFVASTTEKELRETRDIYSRLSKKFTDLMTKSEATDETLKEIRIEHEVVADTIISALINNENRRKAITDALVSDKDIVKDCPSLITVSHIADNLAEQFDERIKTLQSKETDKTIKDLTKKTQELRARKILEKHEELVLSEIERKKKLAAYGLCIDDTKTQTITLKSTAVTRTAVTKKLKQSFQDELTNLSFRHIEVELKEVGGVEGVLYHKLILTRAPGVDLPKVVSEGEQRCLSIAAFFAELSTADDRSGIVFDDPVSSLDYKWREGVAGRLIEEAKKRQVIVFTHDIVFLLLIKQFAEEKGVKQLDQHVRQLSVGAGVCEDELPWVALKVKKRIGHLKKLLQDAEKLHRDGHQSAYEREASLIYGYLREAWERGLEEVLLCGVVERYRPGVQTQQVSKIADITTEDCNAVEVAMTKCSKWLPGHDQAAAARADIPDPEELKTDIEALESWVTLIRKRRE